MNRTLLIALTALASACAFTEDRVHLTYMPMDRPGHLSGAENVVATVDIRDARSDRTRVSVKKNGYGIEMAAIRSDAPLERVVLSAVETELRTRA